MGMSAIELLSTESIDHLQGQGALSRAFAWSM